MDTKKLRQKILDLAIRGKLVPQDPSDEPASLLLQRIRDEKERLIKEGKIKRSKTIATDEEIEAPFEIPESWEWVKIENVCHTCLGKMLDKQKNTGTPQFYLRNINVRWGSFDLSDLLQMPFEDDEDERYSVCYDDVVVCEGGEPGRCAIWKSATPIKFQKALHRIRCFNGILNKYLQMILRLYSQNGMLENYFTGSTIKHLTGDSLNSIIIPLPSFAEQQRIANEVERWFAVIDALESNEGDLLKAIDQAKSKILDLAIHGKLVPQDPNDEPAIELLKRINPKFEACDNELDTNQLPDSWCWAKMESISTDSADGPFGSNLKREHYTSNKEVRIIQLSNIGEEGWREDNTKYTTFEHLKEISRSEVLPNDIVIAKMMPAGRAILCPNIEKKYVLSSDAVKFHIVDELDYRYILYSINTEMFRKQVYDDVQGVTRVRTSLQKLRKYCLPIPPYQEQLRIVAKIEELFGILDGIKEPLEA